MGFGRGAFLGGGGGGAAAGSGVTTSSDSSLTIADTDAIINKAQTATWTGVHTWSNTATPVKATITDGAAAAQLEAGRLSHTTSTTATAGIGAYLSFGVENGAGTEREAGRVVGLLRTVTDGAEAGNLLFQTIQAGTVANAFHTVGSALYSSATLGIGTMSATGSTTIVATWNATGSMMVFASNSAANGGWAFTGTANTSGARQYFTITPSANTGSTASTEINKFAYNTYTNTWAAGALATQREFCIFAPTYAFASASTITTAATVYIDGPPIAGTNATITTGHPLWIDSGTPRIDSTSANSTTACVLTANSGPAGANTAVQEWLTINIGGTVRYIPTW